MMIKKIDWTTVMIFTIVVILPLGAIIYAAAELYVKIHYVLKFW
jgi:hypothetical protein